MNVKQLYYFLVVAQEHQITSAAKLLYMAQPPLSYQIKQLEKELGTKLFVRKTHGLELTSAGEIFQRYAQQIVDLESNAREELNREGNGTMGVIRLGLISSAGKIIPNQKLHRFKQFYPDVSFQITEANTFELIKQLRNNLLDIAVVRTPFNQQGLVTKMLAADEMVAVYNPDAVKLAEKKLGLEALAKQPLILYRRFEAIFNDSFAHKGLHPFYAVKCDDARTAISWADNGMGVALVPRSIAEVTTKQHFLPVNYSPWQSEVGLVWQTGKKNKPLVQRFIDAFGDSV